jgi:hypothetical protein
MHTENSWMMVESMNVLRASCNFQNVSQQWKCRGLSQARSKEKREAGKRKKKQALLVPNAAFLIFVPFAPSPEQLRITIFQRSRKSQVKQRASSRGTSKGSMDLRRLGESLNPITSGRFVSFEEARFSGLPRQWRTRKQVLKTLL